GHLSVCRLRPPRKAPLREPLQTEPVPLPIIEQELEGCARAVAEDVHRPLQGVGPEPLPTHGGQSIDPVAKIHRVGREKNPTLGGQLEHAGPSRKHWRMVRSAVTGACRANRAPSGRWNSTVRLPWLGGTAGGSGTSTKSGAGAGVAGACWAVIR